jgi:RNA polymerase sigma-70 factor (family 1)
MKTNMFIDEEICAARLQQGDEAAFRYVMDRYLPIIINFSKKFISNKAVAEDVAEETFIKLWKNRAQIGSFQSVKAFLFIAARNGCLNELRRAKNLERRHHAYTASIEEETGLFANEIIRAEVKAEIYKTMEHLPEKIKRVFQLSFLEGLPNREIARRLDVSVNTVKAQKSRAIELVKERLQGKDILAFVLLVLASR